MSLKELLKKNNLKNILLLIFLKTRLLFIQEKENRLKSDLDQQNVNINLMHQWAIK
jgi:hypothetical protein